MKFTRDMDLVGNDWLHLSGSSQFLMDNFLMTATGAQYDPTDTRPLGYYDWTDLPFYYELASQFNTSDTFYAPVPDSTIINRMYLFAGYIVRTTSSLRRQIVWCGSGRRSSGC